MRMSAYDRWATGNGEDVGFEKMRDEAADTLHTFFETHGVGCLPEALFENAVEALAGFVAENAQAWPTHPDPCEECERAVESDCCATMLWPCEVERDRVDWTIGLCPEGVGCRA